MTALVDIPADQIVHYSQETILDWLIARNEQRRARLLAACQKLRADSAARERAIENLLRAATTATRPA